MIDDLLPFMLNVNYMYTTYIEQTLYLNFNIICAADFI